MSQEKNNPSAVIKVLIVVALAVVVGGTILAKNGTKKDDKVETRNLATQVDNPQKASHGKADSKIALKLDPIQQNRAIPKMIDLGADKCIPCKMMAPILEELKKEYAGKFKVQFIDVWKNPQAGKEYGVQMIPTQIFYDASGKERFRHQGFFSKEDILAKWRELGVE